MGIMDMEKLYDRVNREALIPFKWIKSIDIIGVKLDLSECFRIDIGVGQGYIVSPLIFNVYMVAVMKEVSGVLGEIFGGEGGEIAWLLLCR